MLCLFMVVFVHVFHALLMRVAVLLERVAAFVGARS